MIQLQVLDMSCGHCANAIKSRIADIDASAEVEIDLANREVKVSSGGLDASAVAAAVRDAGYSPSRVSLG
jgi:copper chaperone